jgi:3-hydroxybutyryl-CoA dehydrogenase
MPEPMSTGELPARVGVVGGGQMGAGIAHAFLAAGSAVVVREASAAAARAAEQRVRASLEKAADRQRLDRDLDEVLGGLVVTTDLAALAGAELVIEAVPEDAALKARVLAELETVATGVVATNTSSLPVGELAAALSDPTRFLGLHFFNPVPLSSLVEIVVPEGAGPDLPARAAGWVRALGRTPVTVRDSPGFATSRLGVALAMEAIRMVEQGVASARDIDVAMELGYRHQMGPLRTTDLVGLDVRLAIAEQLHDRLGPRFEPPQMLRDLVNAGHLGRKTGRGFHDWD